METTLNTGEESQLAQTIEMFEVITESQPLDTQSLEILKEAYHKLGRAEEAVRTAKRLASAYVQMGQLSSAILEYETILQRHPDDAEARAELGKIESAAAASGSDPAPEPTVVVASSAPGLKKNVPPVAGRAPAPGTLNDGRDAMRKIFVDGKHITAADFDTCWPVPDYSVMPPDVTDPLVQRLADKSILPLDKSLRLLVDKGRTGFLPLERYDPDLELARTFSAAVCRRWCVLPFDRLSKSLLVATANPFNQQAARELAESSPLRVVWYVASPVEIVKNLRKIFRQ
ncbi:MAG: tetratricopeptide repeat protein [Limisphaerales bacterium]